MSGSSPGAAGSLLEARHLGYTYRGGILAVRDVSFSIPPATMTALIGANGSGKSTLIRMLSGLLAPDSGEIALDGRLLDSLPPRERAKSIAYVPQSTASVFPFEVIDVVLSGRTPHTSRFGFETDRDRERAVEALEMVGAAHLAGRRITDLSGGERQMVILARALAQEPRLLLLDEPSSALDLKHRAALVRTLARLREERGISVLMATHDLMMIDPLFRWVVAMRQGELFTQGPAEAVLQTGVLSDVYGDPHVRAQRIENRTIVWMQV
jgi:iron complex transport system ATP-binding protein